MKAALSLILMLFASPALTDIKITVRDQNGETSTFSSNGSTARMDNPQQPGYALINLQSGQMKMVDSQRREIMEMGMPAASAAATARSTVKVNLTSEGSGPLIAGYRTQRFDINADGIHCGSVFGSQAVLKLKGIEGIFAALSKMQRQTTNMMGAFRGMHDPCQEADLQMSEKYQTTGAPLRMLDSHGQLESEVIDIDKNARFAASHYHTPSDYRVTNMQQQMNAARRQQQQQMMRMQQGVPNMDRMMQQQGLPPEAMEQMRQMQQMFQQMPQQ